MNKSIFSIALLTTNFIVTYNAYASDTQPLKLGFRELFTIQYPFSNTDKALRFNHALSKVASPFCEKSVESFSKKDFISIESEAYQELITSAQMRCSNSMESISNELKQLGNGTIQQHSLSSKLTKETTRGLLNIEREKLNNIVIEEDKDAHTIRLSENTLMYLLQWSYKIEIVWSKKIVINKKNAATTEQHDFDFEISLVGNTVKAPKKLRAFLTKKPLFHMQDNAVRYENYKF